MDVTEASPRLGRADRPDPASARPALPAWVPPATGLLFGAAVALQAPTGTLPGLLTSGIGLAVAVAGWALVTAARARRGIPRRRGGRRAGTAAVLATVAAAATSRTASAELRWVYAAAGVLVAGLVWYLLRRTSGKGPYGEDLPNTP